MVHFGQNVLSQIKLELNPIINTIINKSVSPRTLKCDHDDGGYTIRVAMTLVIRRSFFDFISLHFIFHFRRHPPTQFVRWTANLPKPRRSSFPRPHTFEFGRCR